MDELCGVGVLPPMLLEADTVDTNRVNAIAMNVILFIVNNLKTV